MAVLTPPVPLTGPGKDLPKECAADAPHKMVPPPRYPKMPECTYPYNKVEKWLDGSITEHNTTSGSEYTNFQTGDLSCRITMFQGGHAEIRQEGPTFYHSIVPSKKKKSAPKSGYVNEFDTQFSDSFKTLHHTVVKSGAIVTESKAAIHKNILFRITNNVTRFISNAKINFTTKIMEIAVKSLLIDGEVKIRGNLKVFGNIEYSKELESVDESASFKLEKLEQEVKDIKTQLAKAQERAEALETATKESLFGN